MIKGSPHKLKIVGRTMIDTSRRHNADQGGRNPLTSYPLVPVGCVMPLGLLKALRERSDQFINPLNYKPYGITALCRILCQIMITDIDKYYDGDILTYLDNREESTSGRASVGHDPKKISLLIPKPIVERVNERVVFFNNSLIGTSSVLRFMIFKGLKKAKIEDLYEHVPAKHLSIMVSKHLTIADLQKRFKIQSQESLR